MWLLSLGFLATLWGIAFTIWVLWRWGHPDEPVGRPMQGPAHKL